jgi:hypothetical protein
VDGCSFVHQSFLLKLSQEFRLQLENLVECQSVEDGRVWFDVKKTVGLSQLNARSIGIVALECHDLSVE